MVGRRAGGVFEKNYSNFTTTPPNSTFLFAVSL
jgi:hypothetical protein